MLSSHSGTLFLVGKVLSKWWIPGFYARQVLSIRERLCGFWQNPTSERMKACSMRNLRPDLQWQEYCQWNWGLNCKQWIGNVTVCFYLIIEPTPQPCQILLVPAVKFGQEPGISWLLPALTGSSNKLNVGQGGKKLAWIRESNSLFCEPLLDYW